MKGAARTSVVEGAGQEEELYQLLEQVRLVPVDLRVGRTEGERSSSEKCGRYLFLSVLAVGSRNTV